MSLADLNSYSGNTVVFTSNKTVYQKPGTTVEIPVTAWNVARELGPVGNVTVEYDFVSSEIDQKTFLPIGNVAVSEFDLFGTGSLDFTDTYSVGGVPGYRGMYKDTAEYDSTFDLNGDWTIEFWFFCTQNDGQQRAFIGNSYEFPGSGVYTGWGVFSNNPQFTGKLGMVYFLEPGGIPNKVIWNFGVDCPEDSWNHLAVVRSGNTATAYLNGTSISTRSITNGFAGDSNNEGLLIGALQPNAIIGTPDYGLNPYVGYMDQIRISSIARYTEDFLVPGVPFIVDDDTLLLLNNLTAKEQSDGTVESNSLGNGLDLYPTLTIGRKNTNAQSANTTISNTAYNYTVNNISTAEDFLYGVLGLSNDSIAKGNIAVTTTITNNNNSSQYVINGTIVVRDGDIIGGSSYPDNVTLDPIDLALDEFVAFDDDTQTPFFGNEYVLAGTDGYSVTIVTEDRPDIVLLDSVSGFDIGNFTPAIDFTSGTMTINGEITQVNNFLRNLEIKYINPDIWDTRTEKIYHITGTIADTDPVDNELDTGIGLSSDELSLSDYMYKFDGAEYQTEELVQTIEFYVISETNSYNVLATGRGYNSAFLDGRINLVHVGNELIFYHGTLGIGSGGSLVYDRYQSITYSGFQTDTAYHIAMTRHPTDLAWDLWVNGERVETAYNHVTGQNISDGYIRKSNPGGTADNTFAITSLGSFWDNPTYWKNLAVYDEHRISTVRRYTKTADFYNGQTGIGDKTPFVNDSFTFALFHFEADPGDPVEDYLVDDYTYPAKPSKVFSNTLTWTMQTPGGTQYIFEQLYRGDF